MAATPRKPRSLERRLRVEYRRWRRQLMFLFCALLIGLISAGFAIAADHAEDWFKATTRAWPWAPLILTPLGFFLLAWAGRTIFVGTQGSGIPQAMAARMLNRPAERRRMLSLRHAVGKFFLTIVGLGCGAAIGREGPTVQIGASIVLQASRIFELERQRGLILAGSAAGIAAAFNAPLAGVVFAIEEMGRSYEQKINGLLLGAVLVAGLVAEVLLGSKSYFGHTTETIAWADWPAVAICGLIGGALGGMFSRLLLDVPPAVNRLRGGLFARRPELFAALCGLGLAVLGVFVADGAFGTGYEVTRNLLQGDPAPEGYGIVKLIASLLSSLAGIAGGIFAPSLAVGAGFGAMLADIMPATPLAVLALLGMVGYFTGVVQAPLTASIIVLEMTDGHQMIMPIIATAMIARAVSGLVCPKPLYHTLAERMVEAIRRPQGR